MKSLILILCLGCFVGCRAKQEISYSIKLGDRSTPAWDSIRSNYNWDSKSPLTVFSDHTGSDLHIEFDGKEVARYDGSRPILVSGKGGDLKIIGRTNAEVLLYITTESPDGSGAVWFKAHFEKGKNVHYWLELPKELAKSIETK